MNYSRCRSSYLQTINFYQNQKKKKTFFSASNYYLRIKKVSRTIKCYARPSERTVRQVLSKLYVKLKLLVLFTEFCWKLYVKQENIFQHNGIRCCDWSKLLSNGRSLTNTEKYFSYYNRDICCVKISTLCENQQRIL